MSEEENLPERAAEVLSKLAEFMPTAEDVANGAGLPEFITAPWMQSLTDPSDPNFADAVIKAEVWLATR